MSTIQLKGFDDIQKGLDKLDHSLRKQVIVDALEASAQPIESDYRSGAHPEIAGGVRTRVLRADKHIQEVGVGTKHPLAHIFEFGTRQRRRSGGARTGKITAMGFARRAFDKNVTAWFGRVGRELGRRMRAS